MDYHETAKLIIVVGVVLVLGGLTYYFLGDKLQWIGRLPGDIRVKNDNVSFYFPLTTMIIFSIMVNVLIRLFRHYG